MNNGGWNNNAGGAAWSPPAQQPWPVADKLQAPVKQVEPEVSPYDSMTQDQVLMKWQELKKALETAKEAEMDMRKYIVKRAFPAPDEGTNKAELGMGYALKAVVKYNYKIKGDVDKIDSVIDKLSALDNEGSFIADRLFKWSATLSVAEYKILDPKYKKIVDEVVEVSEAAPTLDIVEPKSKK